MYGIIKDKDQRIWFFAFIEELSGGFAVTIVKEIKQNGTSVDSLRGLLRPGILTRHQESLSLSQNNWSLAQKVYVADAEKAQEGVIICTELFTKANIVFTHVSKSRRQWMCSSRDECTCWNGLYRSPGCIVCLSRRRNFVSQWSGKDSVRRDQRNRASDHHLNLYIYSMDSLKESYSGCGC